MKRAPALVLSTLSASVALNLVLGWFAFHPFPAPAPSSPVTTKPAATPKPKQAPTPAARLDWQALEAPDFPTFIQNLRGAGCPEHTIRHLVQAELHELYDQKRAEVTRQPSSPGGTSRADKLKQLGDEEAVILAQLMQSAMPSPATTGNAISNTSAVPEPVRDVTVSLTPAAFLVGNAPGHSALGPEGLALQPTDTRLDAGTTQTLADMRQHFGEQVTRSGAAVNSREYQREWLKAQRNADEAFSSMYGGDALIRAQQQALVQNAAASAPASK